jgi:hypothetical protein
MKAKIKVLMVVLTFSVFCVWAEWERTDVFLLPDENTINGLGRSAICTSEDKIFGANRLSGSVSILSENQKVEGIISPSASISSPPYPNPFNPECYIPVSTKGKPKDVKFIMFLARGYGR